MFYNGYTKAKTNNVKQGSSKRSSCSEITAIRMIRQFKSFQLSGAVLVQSEKQQQHRFPAVNTTPIVPGSVSCSFMPTMSNRNMQGIYTLQFILFICCVLFIFSQVKTCRHKIQGNGRVLPEAYCLHLVNRRCGKQCFCVQKK